MNKGITTFGLFLIIASLLPFAFSLGAPKLQEHGVKTLDDVGEDIEREFNINRSEYSKYNRVPSGLQKISVVTMIAGFILMLMGIITPQAKTKSSG